MHYTAQDILDTLDQAGLSGLPMFDGGTAFIAPRLDIYRDDQHWAIVFNMVGWFQDAQTVVYPLGPRMRIQTWVGHLNAQHGDWQAKAMAQMQAHADDPIALTQAMMDGYGKGEGFIGEHVQQLQDIYSNYQANASANGPSEADQYLLHAELDIDYDDDKYQEGFPVAARVRGTPIDAAELAELQRLARLNESEGIVPNFVVPFLERHRDQLWATPEEAAVFYEGGLPPHFMTLHAWEHPDLANEQKTADMPAWQSLAHAIATNDPSAYRPGTPNTDWRRWENV